MWPPDGVWQAYRSASTAVLPRAGRIVPLQVEAPSRSSPGGPRLSSHPARSFGSARGTHGTPLAAPVRCGPRAQDQGLL